MKNPSDEEIEKILRNYKTIAIVGLSKDPEKSSYKVASYLKDNGYKIIPVNPGAQKILDETAYPDLKSIPEKIEIVDIFRKPEDIPPIVDEAIEIGVKVIWMQSGIKNEKAAEKASKSGMTVIEDRCMKIEHSLI